MSAWDEFQALRPSGGFGLIMADPPWRIEMRSERGEAKAPQAHYACMPLHAIARLPVRALAADNCLLWLWATAPMLVQQLEVINAWGFTYKTHGVWAKHNAETGKSAFGTGYLLRNAHEPFLIATRGAPKTTRSVRSLILARAREHSRKPDAAFAAAEELMPDARRIELFSREDRPGWVTWGHETGKFA